tara:strand:+ start:1142 stop:1822 length:681 start_codon:yes stop_codon:yes gene_type:complete
MPSKVIVHNTVSLDGSTTGFAPDIGLHYEIAGRYNPGLMLVGSRTAKTGIEMFTEEVPVEDESDFNAPELAVPDTRPYWVIPDSRGIMQDLLHVYRRSEYCKDVAVLVSKTTACSYLRYLADRNYEYFVSGEDHVNYREALATLDERYGPKVVLTDSGGTLNCMLLQQALVDEISLLVAPVLVGSHGTNLFRRLEMQNNSRTPALELIKSEATGSNHVWLAYKVSK